MPINRKVIDEVRTLYHDAIGAYPSVIVCKEITQLLITGAITRRKKIHTQMYGSQYLY